MHIRSVKVPRNVAGSTVAQWYCRTVKKHYMNDLISRIPRRWHCQRVLHVSHNIGPVSTMAEAFGSEKSPVMIGFNRTS